VTYFLCFLILLIVSLFATFRIAEMNWRKTFWADVVGTVALAIGGFWKALIYGQMIFSPLYESPHAEFAIAVFYIGVALVMWSATCHRLRRRASDPKPVALAPCDEEEVRYGGTE
jgi:hypothetical protein